jgi:hypothetical protein
MTTPRAQQGTAKGVILYNCRVLKGGTNYHDFLHDMLLYLWSQKPPQDTEVIIAPDSKSPERYSKTYVDKYGLKYSAFKISLQAFRFQEELGNIPENSFGGQFRVSLSQFTNKPILEYKVEGRTQTHILVDIDKL